MHYVIRILNSILRHGWLWGSVPLKVSPYLDVLCSLSGASLMSSLVLWLVPLIFSLLSWWKVPENMVYLRPMVFPFSSDGFPRDGSFKIQFSKNDAWREVLAFKACAREGKNESTHSPTSRFWCWISFLKQCTLFETEVYDWTMSLLFSWN